HGAAALPRDARALHDQRARGARDVLRLVPRPARRRRGCGVRHGVPVLRRHDRALPAGRGDRGAGGAAIDTSVVVVTYDALPRVAVVAPRRRYHEGRLQRSVRGFPTLWRIATEYLFLRKLAPRSRAFNAFYAGGFDHDRDCAAEWIMGAVWLVRRAAIEEVGPADEAFFLFSEETDWAYRFHQAG